MNDMNIRVWGSQSSCREDVSEAHVVSGHGAVRSAAIQEEHRRDGTRRGSSGCVDKCILFIMRIPERLRWCHEKACNSYVVNDAETQCYGRIHIELCDHLCIVCDRPTRAVNEIKNDVK